jgi:hypothetical protein
MPLLAARPSKAANIPRSDAMKPKRIIRPKEAMARLSVGHTYFYEAFVRTGRLRLIPLAGRSRGVLESDLDALIDELAAARNQPKSQDDERADSRV